MFAGKTGSRTFSRRGLHGQVAIDLGRRIVTGRIAEGEILPREDAASAELNVSRTAYREAVKVLAAKGLLASRPRVGTRVRPRAEWNMLDPDILSWATESGLTCAFADALFEFRLVFEPAAAELAAARGRAAEIAEIRRALADMKTTAPTTRENVLADLAFHAALLRASGNELLSSLIYVVEALLARSFAISAQLPGAAETSNALHEKVLRHIERGRPGKARKAMTTLLISAREDIEAALPLHGGAPET